jgi:predicted metalloprotease with PDZ domain
MWGEFEMLHARILALLLVLGALGFVAQNAAQANMAPPLDEFRLGLAIDKTKDGPQITNIEKDSIADKAGLKKGDLILAIDRRYAKKLSSADLKSFADDAHVWPVDLIVVRDGEEVLSFRLQS